MAIAMAACRGDTLYDAPTTPGAGESAPPPAVAVTLPVAGAQVLAGRSMHVRAQAVDTLGVVSLQLEIRGAATGSVSGRYDPPRDTAVLDTTIAIPAGVNGRVEIVATAKNALGGTATTAARSVSASGVESTAPAVAISAVVPARMEVTDRIHLHITAADNDGGSGLARVGATVLALSGAKPDTLVLTVPARSYSAATGTVTYDVDVAPPAGQTLPANLALQTYAFAVDSSGNCSAATTTASALRCRSATVKNATVTVGEAVAVSQPTLLVTGRSTALPSGTVIADLVPDATRGLLYFSNFSASRLEAMNVATGTLASPVLVGAEPWGVAFNRTSDTLIVANSGGTNISYVPLGASGPSGEALTQRVRTQNADLYQIVFSVKDTVFDNGVRDTAYISMTIVLRHYSDRPQFIGQDNAGRIVYSTLPTLSARPGTIRVLEKQSGWQVPESRLAIGVLPMGPDTLLPTFEPDTLAIINIDSMRASTTRCVTIYDHIPGTETPISAAACDPTALASLQDVFTRIKGQGSDIRIFHFNTQLLTFADTSFVATSADHRYLAFAEGAKSPGGRLVMWNGDAGSFSNGIEIADVVDNTSDHLVGLDLNQNGSLGAARGLNGAYYFTNDLRLQGSRTVSTAGRAGAGVAIDPRNAGLGVYGGFPSYDGTQLSYVPTTNRSIKIYDTVNFAERGEIQIRDNIVGPLKASRPLSSDAGVLTKLYGVTDGGAAVVVNVLPTDIH